jgi:hypothetical protein
MTSRMGQSVIGILLLQAPLTQAQTLAPRLQFDVASIKAANPTAVAAKNGPKLHALINGRRGAMLAS